MSASCDHDLSGEQSNFRELLNAHRKSSTLTDVTLKHRDNLYPAHRAVLSLYSPVLAAAVSDHWSWTDQWSSTKICPISDEYVDAEIMEDLLSFLYTGKIKLTVDNVQPVCIAAHFLQISRLLEISVQYLCRLITIENVLELYTFSNRFQLELLRDSCLQQGKVFQDPLIEELSFKDFNDLIIASKHHGWNSIKFKENIFQCIIRWTESNLSERSKDLPILLENIRLDELPSDQLEFLNQTVYSLSSTQLAQLAQLETNRQNLIVFGRESFLSKISGMIWNGSPTGVWKQLPDELIVQLSKYSLDFIPTVVNNRDIIVCGSEIDPETNEQVNSVEMFRWTSQTWHNLPIHPDHPSIGLSIVEHDGNLYVSGRRALLCYCFETEQWKRIASMNVPRSFAKLISFKNNLYVVGGAKTIERYDPALDEWTKMAQMDYSHYCVTLHQERIYAGSDRGFGVYDPEKNLWSRLPTPDFTSLMHIASLNGRLLAFVKDPEGREDDKRFIHEFDPPTQEWSQFSERPQDLPTNSFYTAVELFH